MPPLTLVAAALVFDDPAVFVDLVFDRDVNMDGLDPSQITVDDAAGTGFSYAGSGGGVPPDAQTVRVLLTATGSAEGDTRLNATAANGLVALDDGAPWAGVTDCPLPFP